MNAMDFIIIAAVILILFAVLFYIRKAKKKGVKCIGCPSGCCSGQCAGCAISCGLSGQEENS